MKKRKEKQEKKSNQKMRVKSRLFLLSMLAASSKPSLTTRIKRLTITSIPKHQASIFQLSTTKRLQGQLGGKQLKFQQELFKGSWRAELNENTLKIDLYHRRLKEEALKNTFVLTVSIPFTRNNTYQNTSVVYSPSSPSPLFKLENPEIQNYTLDQHLYVFKDRKVLSPKSTIPQS